MKTGLRAVGIAALIVGATAPAMQAQDVTSRVPLRVEGRLQPQFFYLDNSDYQNQVGPTNQIFLRRARFRIRMNITDPISVMLNPYFEGTTASLRIQDAYLDWRLSKKASNTHVLLRTGQFKRQFGRYENKSSTNLPSLERGAGVGMLKNTSNDIFKSAGFLSRDVGAVLFVGNTTSPAHDGFGKNAAGETPKHGWGLSFQVFNGQGASASDVNNGKSFGARGTFRLLEQLDLGAAVFVHDGIVGADSSFTNVAYGFEAEWGRMASPGFWAVGEVMLGEAFNAAKTNMFGTSIIAAYHIRMKEGGLFYAIEPAGQFDYADPDTDTDSDGSVLFRVGVNGYVTSRTQIRVMLENQSFEADGASSIFGVRTGVTVSW